ncbi:MULTISPECIES: NAD(P)H-dependent flavin oxidoreductase [Bombella]|uniref:Nitronate monooxygenase n=1 Tax=Bombella pollinis TaxID=2967337 RepID=A0ABT3WKT0_9PROT|nr:MULTISPECIES: nitronate monooxygenase [Bombella]MCT6854956.1 nitronate monooxygenase [Bombella apis]MCX5619523.1 nitronate monooxygenase [Bombella pollinis]MUG04232.1 nitronate monooxygenase [Bombella sp. ESL0378]MUG89726.1 nitronate monooxygenase [Bombella sp. ESL0385]
MKSINAVRFGGQEVLPLIEGGKGVSVSNGISAGYWAAAGGVGTISAVNADSYDEQGRPVPQLYHGKTRRERQGELVRYAIEGGIAQAKIAHDISGGRGRIHANFLWEMGAAEDVITGILEGAPGLIHGLTCGAGMPYRLSEIAARFGVPYYPIVSSGRAFSALWKRSYVRSAELLGGVVYEDPWRAGGHNGLSNTENPLAPEEPYHRVVALRKVLNGFGLQHVPIIMAGGVWHLEEWNDWLDNPEIGLIAFQFGTRPLLTKESPIPEAWKQLLLTLKEGDVYLNRFSPTGFYSSAVQNSFLRGLRERSERQVAFKSAAEGVFDTPVCLGGRGREVFVQAEDVERIARWKEAGYTQPMRTPDDTVVFETLETARQVLADQAACMGCLSQCRFSNWSQKGPAFNTGQRADPRSFCIQKTLQEISHIQDVPLEEQRQIVDHNLVFGGTNAWRFATDPFYANGHIPTVKELVERIMTGR